jgi:hypothetical protein
VNGYKRQPFTAHRAVDPPRSCVSRSPRRHGGLQIVAALHNRERSNNEPQESHTTHRSQWWPRRRFATEFRDARISSIPRRGHRFSVRPPSRRRLGPVPMPLGLPSVSKLWPTCGHIRDRWARVSRDRCATACPQSTTCRLSFTLSQTRTISAKRVEVHQNLSPRPSPGGTPRGEAAYSASAAIQSSSAARAVSGASPGRRRGRSAPRRVPGRPRPAGRLLGKCRHTVADPTPGRCGRSARATPPHRARRPPARRRHRQRSDEGLPWCNQDINGKLGYPQGD